MQHYYYKWQKLFAKVKYHLRIVEILTAEIDNTTDHDDRRKLVALRCHHRRMAQKYIARADICWQAAGEE